MRPNKTIKLFINFFFGPLLFLWLLFSIYHQIQQQPHVQQTWQQIQAAVTSRRIAFLIVVLILMVANWSVEAAKWRLLVNSIRPVTYRQALKAVLSGVSFSVAMPNRMGEYAGRVLYLPEGSRLRAIPVSVAGGISQLLVTLGCGSIGLAVLHHALVTGGLFSAHTSRILFWSATLATLVLTVFYFNIQRAARLVPQRLQGSRFQYMLQSLSVFDASLLGKLLSLSIVRYIIFSLQYVLLFSFFEVHVAPGMLWSATAVLFLVLTLVPTIALAELGLRGKVSLQLLGLFTANSLGVVLASATAWAVNLMLPALAGSALILTLKVFKRKHEMV